MRLLPLLFLALACTFIAPASAQVVEDPVELCLDQFTACLGFGADPVVTVKRDPVLCKRSAALCIAGACTLRGQSVEVPAPEPQRCPVEMQFSGRIRTIYPEWVQAIAEVSGGTGVFVQGRAVYVQESYNQVRSAIDNACTPTLTGLRPLSLTRDLGWFRD